MKKLLLLLVIVLSLAACSTYRTATSSCATYNDMRAVKERADYPKLHKKNQFNPKKHYNNNLWGRIWKNTRR